MVGSLPTKCSSTMRPNEYQEGLEGARPYYYGRAVPCTYAGAERRAGSGLNRCRARVHCHCTLVGMRVHSVLRAAAAARHYNVAVPLSENKYDTSRSVSMALKYNHAVWKLRGCLQLDLRRPLIHIITTAMESLTWTSTPRQYHQTSACIDLRGLARRS